MYLAECGRHPGGIVSWPRTRGTRGDRNCPELSEPFRDVAKVQYVTDGPSLETNLRRTSIPRSLVPGEGVAMGLREVFRLHLLNA